MPYCGELNIPISYLKPEQAVLELGCGAGHGTRALLDHRLVVTAVDNSSAMLAYAPREATLVLSNIETLDLDRRFDAAILPTGLINHAVPATRVGFADCARRHLRLGGWFYLERQDPK